MVTQDADQDVVRAGRNLKQVWTVPSDLANANDVLKRETVLITVDGIRRIAELCTAPRFRARKIAGFVGGEEEQA